MFLIQYKLMFVLCGQIMGGKIANVHFMYLTLICF